MSLYVFSTAILSLTFMLVFNSWWLGDPPFKIHLSVLFIATITILSSILMMAIYPLFTARSSATRKKTNLDKVSWAHEVSSNLSTPAAVLDGYNLTFANKAFLAELGMLGMSDQIVGMPITNIIHPGDHQHLAMLFAETAFEREQEDTVQIRILNMDGTILPALISLSPLQHAGHSDVKLLQFSSPSSYPQTYTDHIDQSNYHLLINQIEQIVFHLNVDQQLMFLNASWEAMLGYTLPQSLNKPLLSFIHPEDRPIAEARINSLIQGKRTKCQLELRLITNDGEAHWVELRAKNTSATKGERSSVIGTLTDISNMKLTEASLRTNRRLLSTLINNTPGMIYRCKNDQHWSFEFVSDGSAEVTGYEPYEMVNNPLFSYVHIIHDEDRLKTWDIVQRHISRQEKFQLVYRIVTRSGHIKWVWEQGKGVFSSAGELLALEGFITDISNQDQVEVIRSFQKLFEQQD